MSGKSSSSVKRGCIVTMETSGSTHGISSGSQAGFAGKKKTFKIRQQNGIK